MGFFIALLRSQSKVSLSHLHRNMRRDHKKLIAVLGLSQVECVSYSQLRRIIMTFDYMEFHHLNLQFFGKAANKEGGKWSALDGKELRGSIDKNAGETRGEAIVLKANHQSKQAEVIGFYSGKKQSEKTVINSFFTDNESLNGECFTLDALHNSSKLLSTIHRKSCGYLVQIKSNQKILLEDLKETCVWGEAVGSILSNEKGHGRIEQREAKFYTINLRALLPKWQSSGMQTLVVMRRKVTHLKSKKVSEETSYYVTNTDASNEELFQAIRGHWRVEANNYMRDTSFGEDYIRSFQAELIRPLSAILTCAFNVVMQFSPHEKFTIFREDLAANWEQVISLFG